MRLAAAVAIVIMVVVAAQAAFTYRASIFTFVANLGRYQAVPVQDVAMSATGSKRGPGGQSDATAV
jgi:hypothetical protein